MLESVKIRDGLELSHPDGTDQFFIFDVQSGERYELNEVSFEMLRRMDGLHDSESLCLEIAGLFECSEGLFMDYSDLVTALATTGLIVSLEKSSQQGVNR